MNNKTCSFRHRVIARRKGRGVLLCTLILFVLCSALNINARADAGDLDVSFGSGGKVTTNLIDVHLARAVAIQNDGRIVVTGDGLFAIRYNADGSLDSSFGSGGLVRIGIVASGTAAAIQKDGKIVISGFTLSAPFNFFVVRLNIGGDLDASFGSGGVVTTNFFGGFDIAQSMAIQGDGKIVVAGSAGGPTGESHYALARYNTDGSLDSSFGVGGKVFTTESPSSDDLFGIGIQSDQRIVAAGLNFLVRYNTNGSLDPSFGVGGLAPTLGVAPESLALQPDGRIVVAGFGSTAFNFAVGRFDSSGNPDVSFGSRGVTATQLSSEDTAFDVAIQADGKIVAAGYTTNPLSGRDFALLRYNSDGALDTTFGTNGVVITDFAGREDIIFGVAIQSDGRIVTAGVAFLGAAEEDVALARYGPGPSQAGNICIQDDRTNDRVSFNPDTGSYTFTQCGGRGVSFSGTAKVQRNQCSIQLKDAGLNQKLSLTFDSCQKKASATITGGGQTFAVIDSETSKNTCSCR
ncbi:MAG: hypothetical protein DMF61_02040 [Blastocatellia bacterium AA13]|nr:MAG: hypothetical protein DMF61_02040 [Blastocatellia bacterium AA13]